MKKSNVITAVICSAAMIFTSYQVGRAEERSDTSYQSKGRIVFDADEFEPVIFDAGDFEKIDSIVTNGKSNLSEALQDKFGSTLSNRPTFEELKLAVDDISTYAGISQRVEEGISEMPDSTDLAKKSVQVTIPKTGYYDTSSAIEIPNDVIKNNTNIKDEIIEEEMNQGELGDATKDKVLSSSTFTSTAGKNLSGAMKDWSNIVTAANIVKESTDDEKVLIAIPEVGYYNTDSEIEVSVDTLKQEISALNSRTIIENIIKMGGTCALDADVGAIAAGVLTIPQTIKTENLTGTIEYQYHYHESSCYYTCNGTIKYENKGQMDGNTVLHRWCTGPCGFNWTGMSDNKYTGPCTTKLIKCGYSNGQIIGATIKY